MYWQPTQIIGEERSTSGSAGFDVINPATEETLCTCPEAGEAEALAALQAARTGFDAWRSETPWRRAQALRRIATLLAERADDIAETMTREVGKPLAESRAELAAAIEAFDWNADETRRIYDRSMTGRVPEARVEVRQEPVGIVLALTAWNFPIGLAARKLSMALAAGCAVILRPAAEAPGTATALVETCLEAGLPPGALNLLHGSPEGVVVPLMLQPDVRKISFTGSTAVGQLLMRQSAETVKKLTMELGGHAPFIVLGDVDVEKVAAAAAAGKFRNSGQVCTAPTRFLVDRTIAEDFSAIFARAASALRVGNGMDDSTEVGPLTTDRQRTKIEDLVADARQTGAKVLVGGARPAQLNRGYFFEPTVLVDPGEDARILAEEPFGPVAVIESVSGPDEAVERANALEYGLASYLFTRSEALAQDISTRVQCGVMGVNTTAVALPEAPFGGVKQSGFGREGGSEGVQEYLQTKFVHRFPAA